MRYRLTRILSASTARIAVTELLFTVLFVAPGLSQKTGANEGAGFPSFGSFAGAEFDTINEGNLNIHFSIPVFQKSGRGLSVSAVLTYDSLIWSAVPAPRDSNGNIVGAAQWRPPVATPWGWNLAPVAGYVTYTRTQTPSGTCGGNTQGIFIRSDYTYHDASGTGHYMGAGQAVEADCNGTPHGLAATTQDGSGYSLFVDTAMNVSVVDVGGSLILPKQFQSAGGGLANPGTVTDTNGNQLTFSGGVLTDTLGTQALRFSTTSTSASVTYPSPTNEANFIGVTLNYSNYTVQTAFLCSILTDYGPTTVQLVSSIRMTDGSTYSFTYEPTPGQTGKTTGRIASVTLPTGGVITYAYPSGGGINCSDGSTPSLTRTTPDGQWTYTRQITQTAAANGNPGTITSSITTATDPLGNATVINFGAGDKYETKRQVYTGSSTLLETIETCYNGASFPCTSTGPAFPITRRTVRHEFPDTTGKVNETDTDLTVSGLVTDVYEYDFGSGSPGSLVRHTATTYAIYNRPATVTVSDASGATQSQTSYFYDETTPTPTTNTPQHVAVTAPRGNLTTVKKLVSGTTTIQKTTTYFDTGTVATDTDFKVPANVTTYGYGANSCGNSYPDTVTNPLWLERTTVWDCNGGVATSITDQNNQFTSYILWRPKLLAYHGNRLSRRWRSKHNLQSGNQPPLEHRADHEADQHAKHYEEDYL